MNTVQSGRFIPSVFFFGVWFYDLFFSSRADVSTFFSASCVPGAAAMAPPLCTLCQGQKSYIRQKNYHCETSHNEPFYNSQGALRSGLAKLSAYKAHLLYIKRVDSQNNEDIHFFYCLFCSVTDVSGVVQEMLHLWTI